MAYAAVTDVQARLSYELTQEQQALCATLLDDAAQLIDSTDTAVDEEVKKVVSCRIVIRALPNPADASLAGVPVGATQGSMSALGYSQSWTIGSGSAGELYLSKVEKKLLGVGNKIGSYSPVQSKVVCNV